MNPFDLAIAARDAGIAQAEEHARRKDPQWPDLARMFIERYSRTTQTFISEDVTDAAAAWGLVSPADPRAWGGPFKKAAHDGIIRRIGFGTSRRRHLSPTILWESCIFVGSVA